MTMKWIIVPLIVLPTLHGNLRISKLVMISFSIVEKKLISPGSITTSKVMWDKSKQLYQHSNKAFQVNIHKKLFQLFMLDSNDVVGFLES